DSVPQGVVTLLLTDIESSVELWDRHAEAMSKALVRHEAVIAEVVGAHDGHLLKSRGEGDATFSVFAKPTDAVIAAVALQRRLGREAWPGRLALKTRVAVHTGEAQFRDGDYFGSAVNRAARIRAVAEGGETLISRTVHDLVVDALPTEISLREVGVRAMKGL